MSTIGIAQATNPLAAGLQTAKEVATLANYRSSVSVLRAFRRGDLPGYKLNPRTVRFHPDDVKRWLDATRIEGKGGAA